VWTSSSVDISAFAGQTVRVVVEAADAGSASLVEAAIDDVVISRL
jgi:aminopeptidase S